MPCLLIVGVHEGINEVLTVPRRHPVNPQPGEQSGHARREEKTLRALLQLGAAVLDAAQSVGGRRRSYPLRGIGEPSMEHRPRRLVQLTCCGEDTSRWAVWLGRHTPEKISGVPKGQLRGVRNPS